MAYYHEDLQLPKFSLHPETLTRKLGHALGNQDIDFPEYPKFSSRYQLQGHEQSLRRLFTQTLIQTIEQCPEKFYIEGMGHVIIFYQENYRWPLRKLKAKIQAANACMQVIHHSHQQLLSDREHP